MLNLLGMIADATGVTATRYGRGRRQAVDEVADRDLIVIGFESTQPLPKQWGDNNSVQITSTASPRPQAQLPTACIQPFDPRAPYYRGGAVELAKAYLGKPFAYISSFWSPLNDNRLVVTVGGTHGPPWWK